MEEHPLGHAWRVRTSESDLLAVASAKNQRCVSQPTLHRFLCYKLPHVLVYQTTKPVLVSSHDFHTTPPPSILNLK